MSVSNISTAPCTIYTSLKPYSVHYTLNEHQQTWELIDHSPRGVHILVYNRDSSSFIVSKQFSPDVLLANIKEPSNGMINTNVKSSSDNTDCQYSVSENSVQYSMESGEVLQLLRYDITDNHDHIEGVRNFVTDKFCCNIERVEKMPTCTINQYFYYAEISNVNKGTTNEVNNGKNNVTTNGTTNEVNNATNNVNNDSNNINNDLESDKVYGRLDKMNYSLYEIARSGIDDIVQGEGVSKTYAVVMGLTWWLSKMGG